MSLVIFPLGKRSLTLSWVLLLIKKLFEYLHRLLVWDYAFAVELVFMISKSYNIFGSGIEWHFCSRIIINLPSYHLLVVDWHLQLLNNGLLVLWVQRSLHLLLGLLLHVGLRLLLLQLKVAQLSWFLINVLILILNVDHSVCGIRPVVAIWSVILVAQLGMHAAMAHKAVVVEAVGSVTSWHGVIILQSVRSSSW